MEKETKLKACPFCGSKLVLNTVYEDGPGTSIKIVECSKCLGRGNTTMEPKKAEEVTNVKEEARLWCYEQLLARMAAMECKASELEKEVKKERYISRFTLIVQIITAIMIIIFFALY